MYDEYLRRNLLVAKAIGANANAKVALMRLRTMKRPPKWLLESYEGIISRTDPLSPDLAKWRDLAEDRPEYVRPVPDAPPRCLCGRGEYYHPWRFCNTYRPSPAHQGGGQ